MSDLPHTPGKTARLPIGVVMRRTPGVTRWAKWSWRAVAVLPGAGPADWRILREADDIIEYHAATLPMELHRADVEAYRVSLAMSPPSIFVILREDAAAPHGVNLTVHAVTASAYEAQDYQDSDELVEPVPMPEGLMAFVQNFVTAHWVDTPFIKRRRDKTRTDLKEDGVGDARIRQTADVYRAPGQQKRREP